MKIKFDVYTRMPKREEILDINFWSIVSDCKAILAGTLTPRTWNDISSTWNKETNIVMERKRRVSKIETMETHAAKRKGEQKKRRQKVYDEFIKEMFDLEKD